MTAASKYVVCALDAFKGTLTSYRGGEAVELAFRRFQDKQQHAPAAATCAERPIATPQTPLQFIHSPMSDGGAGLLDSLTYVPPHKRNHNNNSGKQAALTAQFTRVFVPPHVRLTGPLGTPLTFRQPSPGEDASVGVSFACDVAHRVVVIEMAEASGLPRIADPAQRSPARTTSYGTGELIAYSLQHMQAQLDAQHRTSNNDDKSRHAEDDADDYGVSVYVGIGGSATNDGGIGALQALGLRIYVRADDTHKSGGRQDDKAGETLLTRPFTGADLARVTRVEMDAQMRANFFHRGRCHSSAAGDAVPPPRRRTYVKQIYLICDVNNPLTGPRGATFIFGPQKCAPVAKATNAAAKSGKPHAEDAPVGEVGSEAQMQMLRALEQGMCNAATRVVASLWRTHQQLRTTAASPSHDAQLQQLMHGVGGGGAGGMSGFFHYVLGAAWLPGADAVAALLGLRNNNNNTASSSLSDDTASAAEKGLLYSNCNIVVSGEGSFDTQTIYYRKTVGRLLEMAVEANVWRLAQYARAHPDCDVMQTTTTAAAAPSLIDDFVVVCGRCGFKSIEACRADVLEVLRRRVLSASKDDAAAAAAVGDDLTAKLQALAVQLSRGRHNANKSSNSAAAAAYTAADVLPRVLPRVTVLPLSPAPFTVRQAMTDTYNCVLHRVEDYLTEAYTGVRCNSYNNTSSAQSKL